MKEGVLQQFGTPDDIYTRPATKFVAEFIGSPAMNMLKALRQSDGSLSAQGVALPVNASQAEALRTHPSASSVTYGLRPESLSISPVDGAQLLGTVRMLEPTGPETYVFLDTAAGPLVTRVAGPRANLDVGEQVGLRWDAQDTHLFDDATEQRLG